MTYRMYDYRCEKCGYTRESLEKIDKEQIYTDCAENHCSSCPLKRVTTNVPKHVKIDVEAKAFVPMHVKRARNLGHGGGTAKTEGRYDNDDPKTYKSKIIVGGGK